MTDDLSTAVLADTAEPVTASPPVTPLVPPRPAMPPTGLSEAGLHHPEVIAFRTRTAPDTPIDPDARTVTVHGEQEHRWLLDSEAQADLFLWCPELTATDEAYAVGKRMMDRAKAAYRVTERTMYRLTGNHGRDGLLTGASLPAWDTTVPDGVPIHPTSTVVVLDGRHTSQALGEVFRTADAVGAGWVVLVGTDRGVCEAGVVTASGGTVFKVPSVHMESAAAAITWLNAGQFQIYLAEPGGPRTRRTMYMEPPYTDRTAFVVGEEGRQLAKVWRTDASRVGLHLPTIGTGAPLPAAVVAGILLYTAAVPKNRWNMR